MKDTRRGSDNGLVGRRREDGPLRCTNCNHWYKQVFFAKDNSSPTGRQSWCRLCKAEWERGPEGAWKRFRAWLQENEPGSLAPPHGWTEALYLERWKQCDGQCEWCGAGLGEWQHGGHRQDRIDNKTTHIPSNCQTLCWVCNRRKSNRPWQTAREEVMTHVRMHGRGRVPWHTIEPWAKRVDLPDPDPYRVEVQLSLLGKVGS